MSEALNRRGFLKAAGSGATMAAFAPALRAQDRATRRPNILVIHADEHRSDCLGAYGNRDVKTPNLDRLAAEGVRFESSFCSWPVCTGSRYSLLSGLYPHEHRGWSNHSTLAPDIATFPKILREAGYRTKAVGKMHFTPTYLDVGFSELELAEQAGVGRYDDDYHRYLMRLGLADLNDLEDQVYRGNARDIYWETCGALVSNLPEEHHSTTWIGDRAVETLNRWDAASANLLMVGFIKPHHPFDPPAPWDKMYDPGALTLLPGWTDKCLDRDNAFDTGFFPNAQLTETQFRRAMAYYYASISHLDQQVGRMIEVLRKKRIYDNTLIVYTSDHGDHMGYHHLLLKGNYEYDSLAKVPLIIKWPGGRDGGAVSPRMVNNIDLAPTLCRAAGCRPGSRMHGADLGVEGPGHAVVFSGNTMARTRTRKLLLVGGNNASLFFNLEEDPLEMQNLYDAPECRAEVKELEAALRAWQPAKRAELCLDEDAPQIAQPNVPPRDHSHRAATEKYFYEKLLVMPGAKSGKKGAQEKARRKDKGKAPKK